MNATTGKKDREEQLKVEGFTRLSPSGGRETWFRSSSEGVREYADLHKQGREWVITIHVVKD